MAATAATFFFGTSPGFQAARSFSSFGWISASEVAPTTTSVALFGLNHVAWKAASWSRVRAPTEASVPEPVNGTA